MLVYASETRGDAGFEAQLMNEGHTIARVFAQDGKLIAGVEA